MQRITSSLLLVDRAIQSQLLPAKNLSLCANLYLSYRRTNISIGIHRSAAPCNSTGTQRRAAAGHCSMSAIPAPVPRVITFVTGNKNKLKELTAILAAGRQLPFEIGSRSLDLPELQGEVEDISKEKCRIAAKEVGGPVIVEDTSLCYNALQGLPGPYIKWFLQKLGHEGLNKLLAGYEDKSAYALCIFVYMAGPEDEPHLFDGRTHGTIVPARGDPGFGWDPIFQPDGFNLTFAEMEKEVKNTISHRYRALDKLRTFLLEQAGTE